MDQDQIDDIVLELSLAAALPINIIGRNLVKAAAAANILADYTSKLPPKELRFLEFAVGPLLVLFSTDLDNPVAAKAALGLETLLPSRVCLKRFIDLGGDARITTVLNKLMGNTMVNLTEESVRRSLVVHCIQMYRIVAGVDPWKIVNNGGLRHLVICLDNGDMELKSIAAGTLAMCSKNMAIVEQMFAYGCIKPIINISDFAETNSACCLSGLGCIVQLCKVPDIGKLVARQGALDLLQKCLLKRSGHSNVSIREKGLYAVAWLSRIPDVKPLLGNNSSILLGLKHELEFGTPPSKFTIVQIILNLHGAYDAEDAFVYSIRDILLGLMLSGMWHARNLCVKCVIMLYRDDENKLYFAQHGTLDTIVHLVTTKSADLYEVPLVALLSLFCHPDIPAMFIDMEAVGAIARLLNVENDIVRDLAIVLLKVLGLYNNEVVQAQIEKEAKMKKHLMDEGKEEDMPMRYGEEYGGLIENYLQRIVENRRDQHYLLEQLEPDDYDDLGATDEEIESYENTFMELDFNCAGELGLDEMKMLMVMMGEEFDEVELIEILSRWDADGSGALDFKEFVCMMMGWTTQFGTGMDKMINEAFQRGAVGKARRDFNKWWNKDAIEAEEIQAIKDKKQKAEEERQELAAEFWDDEKIRLAREKQEKVNDERRANTGSGVTEDVYDSESASEYESEDEVERY